MSVVILVVDDDGELSGIATRRRHCRARMRIEFGAQLLSNVLLTGCFDGIEARIALLSAELFELFERRPLVQVVTEYSDIDVFGKACD